MAEEYGGRGLDYLGYGLIVEQVGRVDSSARTVVSVQTSLVCGSIERWGTEEQKREWLPRLCSGEALGCFALTEPDFGSDAASLRTRAKKIDSGWSITGNKMWISMGNVADLALVFAQTDPEKKHKGLACFLVPTASDGYSSQEIHGKLGLRSSDTAEISLDEVEVPDDAMLGEIGDGFKVAMSALDNGRYSVAAGCVGICDGCVDASVAFAKERKQFGVPIASFQLIQELIADMVVKRDAARMLVWRAGALKDRGVSEHRRDLDRQVLRDRGGGRMRERRDPGPRRLRLCRRLPGRALSAGRPGHHPVRGDLADPQADHRPRRHRHQRDDPARALVTPLVETTAAGGWGSAGSTGPRRATRSAPGSARSSPTRWSASTPTRRSTAS